MTKVTSATDLVEETDAGFRVDSLLYTDPAIYDLEIKTIFEQTWICLGHESQVASPGDYFTTVIGRQPVVVTRDRQNGALHVLFNRCRHRGATVCDEACGNTRFLRCGYHGWTYDLTGRLTAVPFRSPHYEELFEESLGLVPVPRTQSLHGFVFASLSPSGPTLADHLGHATDYLAAFARFGGEEPSVLDTSAGVSRLRYHGNWKLQLENTVDTYHPEFVHRSQGKLIERRRGKPLPRTPDKQRELRTWDLGGGHGAFDLAPGGPKAGVTGSFFQGPAFHISIFPNLCLLPTQIRLIKPLAVDRTAVDAYPVAPAGLAPDAAEKRLRAYEEFYGSAGFGAPDDIEMFDRVQAGVAAETDVGGLRWIDMSRGLSYEKEDEVGRRYGQWTDEGPQRAIYRGWKRCIGAAERGGADGNPQ